MYRNSIQDFQKVVCLRPLRSWTSDTARTTRGRRRAGPRGRPGSRVVVILIYSLSRDRYGYRYRHKHRYKHIYRKMYVHIYVYIYIYKNIAVDFGIDIDMDVDIVVDVDVNVDVDIDIVDIPDIDIST